MKEANWMGLADFAQRLKAEADAASAPLSPADFEPKVIATEDSDSNVLEQIVELPIDQLHDFPKSRYNRYAIHTGERMQELVDSIRCNGILEPVVVRPMGEGYEVVSGKNRREAARALGYKAIPCIIRGLDDTEALCQLNFLNGQYRELRPSEKAFSYQLEHEQESNFGFRPDANLTLFHSETRLNLNPDTESTLYHSDTKSKSDNASRTTKYRYRQLCRFTLDGYLDAVDSNLIKLGCAIELASLSEKQQAVVWEVFFEESADPVAYRDPARTLKADIVEKLLHLAERLPSFSSPDVDLLFTETEDKPSKMVTKLDLQPLRKKYPQLADLPAKEIERVVDRALEIYLSQLIFAGPNFGRAAETNKEEENHV